MTAINLVNMTHPRGIWLGGLLIAAFAMSSSEATANTPGGQTENPQTVNPSAGVPVQNKTIVKPAFGATTFQAQTVQVMAAPRQIVAGTLKWQCQANQCRASGSAAAADACQALAAQAGPLRSFNVGSQSLDGAALAKCNGVVTANRQPSPAGKHNPTPAPAINAAGVAPRIAAVDIGDRKIKFENLRRGREQAAAAARAKVPTGTPRSGVNASAYKGIPGASIGIIGRPTSAMQLMKVGGTDCDDYRREVNPLAAEICDRIDNNCNGFVDEGQTLPRYLDADGDGHGDPATRLDVCPSDISNAATRAASGGGGWLVEIGNDCNDSDPDRWRDCGVR